MSFTVTMDAQRGLHQRFGVIARRQPQHVAVRAGRSEITYGQLDAASDRVGASLRRRGIGPGDRVGLCCGRGIPLITGMLGILKADGVYVPIDPAFPASRTDLIASDSALRTVLSDVARAAVGGGDAELLDIAQLASGPPAGSPAPGPAAGAGGAAAYVIYTSGSTGTPKGVQVTHDNVIRLFDNTAHWFGFDASDVWMMFHSPCFDFSVWEIWGALLHGGTLVIAPASAVSNPVRLLTMLAAERITVLNQTPSAFRLLAAADGAAVTPLSLRVIIFGGERLDVAILRDWIAAHGDERPRLVNMYGITETTVHVTYRRICRGDLARPERSPVGVPIPDLRVSLHDADGHPVPDGTPGEIWVSGAGVAAGYLNRPELTAERFVRLEGGPAYRSGDLGVIDDGELVHCGRLDQQIKVRGYRIEPFEVEAVLLTHPEVAAVVVTSHDFGGGDVRLVGYVQWRAVPPGGPGQDTPEERLHRHAARLLPAHLCPSEYVAVAEIPLTAQGKADLPALRKAGRPARNPIRAAPPPDAQRDRLAT
jgi:amino acid adenylation domain-containing protein